MFPTANDFFANEDENGFENAAARNARGRLIGDENLHVQFYKRPLKMTQKSLEEGRPIFQEFDFCRILVPGDKNNIPDVQVTQELKDRFPNDWAHYQQKTTEAFIGTPIEQWHALNLAQKAEFKAQGIHTVEALADLNDAKLPMGGHDLKKRAKAFLEASKTEAIETRAAETAATIKELQLANAGKDAMLAAMQAQLDKLTASTTKRASAPASKE